MICPNTGGMPGRAKSTVPSSGDEGAVAGGEPPHERCRPRSEVLQAPIHDVCGWALAFLGSDGDLGLRVGRKWVILKTTTHENVTPRYIGADRSVCVTFSETVQLCAEKGCLSRGRQECLRHIFRGGKHVEGFQNHLLCAVVSYCVQPHDEVFNGGKFQTRQKACPTKARCLVGVEVVHGNRPRNKREV